LADEANHVSNPPTTRREFLKLVASASVVGSGAAATPGATATPAGAPTHAVAVVVAAIGDEVLRIELDPELRARVFRLHNDGRETALTHWASADYLVLADGNRVDRFALRDKTEQPIAGSHGAGRALTVVGTSPSQIEKTVRLELFDRYPGFAILHVSYRNISAHPVAVAGWHNADLELVPGEARGAHEDHEFWSYCGSTHEDRRDWVQPVRAGFAQDNYMGMSASDYGGGTPIVDVWRRDCGLAVGHLETTPRLVSLPVKRTAHGTSLGIAGKLERTLAPGATLETPESFVATHSGDYFATLDAYRRIMGDRGLHPASPPEAAYESIWCAWGYERQCTPQLIEGTLSKVKDLGLKWAVIDDGWQSNVGDWNLHPAKFPQGAADMQRLVGKIRAASLKPRLWVAPLAAAPGSDLLHDHTDMLLRDRDGAPQLVSWWNSFYLCPAYDKTVEYHRALIKRFIGEWGFAGLKVDGQHLNGVAPCYNPAHNHARPEESVEKLQDFFHAMYTTAQEIDPNVVMELCPCGTSYSFFNFASMNQAPASDPESSWQVRHKGKTLKALMGPSAAFAGDHVELSDGKDDFASTVGIGAIVSTKFTWPEDPKPKDSFLLTPEKEALWRKWIALYNERLLPKGTYRGELYDIGFDRPETHVVEKSGRLFYALYAQSFQGPVTLKGLAAGKYRVRDYFNERELGEVAAPSGQLPVSFEHFLVLEAIPA
jgi:alpha-galactosidase